MSHTESDTEGAGNSGTILPCSGPRVPAADLTSSTARRGPGGSKPDPGRRTSEVTESRVELPRGISEVRNTDPKGRVPRRGGGRLEPRQPGLQATQYSVTAVPAAAARRC
eukprot:72769-Hanusia_phi.AAC.1